MNETPRLYPEQHHRITTILLVVLVIMLGTMAWVLMDLVARTH